MSRTVFCSRLKKDLPGLNAQPFPGAKGQQVFDNVSEQAWLEWQHIQTMLINEKHLNLMDKENFCWKNALALVFGAACGAFRKQSPRC